MRGRAAPGDWGLRKLLTSLLEAGPYPGRAAIVYRLAVSTAAVVGTAMRVIDTDDSLETGLGAADYWVEFAAVAVLTLDLLAQGLNAALNRPGRSRAAALFDYLRTPGGIIDLVAALPFWVTQIWPIPFDLLTALGLVRFLKLARYSPALATLESVIARESRQLRSALFIMLMLVLTASTALYLVERGENPQAFGSIPEAMWWAAVTLTTLGYGDVVPISPLGKFLAGCTAVLGVGMFALPASILASGFAEEMKRRSFLQTWRMVARVPFFAELDADQIAAIGNLLRFIAASQGDVLIRAGEIGDRMFFIVSGIVTVDLGGGRTTTLEDGDFFGEIALLHKARRTATVSARTRCELLALDLKDFRHLLQGMPHVAEAIAKTARERLHESGITFTEADDDPAAK
jgi:voltage-gated potassium channel